MTQKDLVAIVKMIALRHQLDTALVCAVVEQESAWDTYAIRPESESGFAVRYGAAYARIVRESKSTIDDRWFRFEDVFYTSYGLMQTMYPVVIETFPEAANLLRYPTRLCDPHIGVEYGCRLLARKIARAGSIETGLLHWNGGGNQRYPAEVLERKERYA